MWIFLNDAFLSIVEPRPVDPASRLLVRARVKGDLERVFSGCRVEVSPEADYRFRTMIDRPAVVSAIADRVMEIDYFNFKSSVAEKPRHDAYLRTWVAMEQLQRSEAVKSARGRKANRALRRLESRRSLIGGSAWWDSDAAREAADDWHAMSNGYGKEATL